MQHVPDSKEFPETEEEWSRNMGKWTREAEEAFAREGEPNFGRFARIRQRFAFFVARHFAKPY